jgi:hypothetical protein
MALAAISRAMPAALRASGLRGYIRDPTPGKDRATKNDTKEGQSER